MQRSGCSCLTHGPVVRVTAGLRGTVLITEFHFELNLQVQPGSAEEAHTELTRNSLVRTLITSASIRSSVANLSHDIIDRIHDRIRGVELDYMAAIFDNYLAAAS